MGGVCKAAVFTQFPDEPEPCFFLLLAPLFSEQRGGAARQPERDARTQAWPLTPAMSARVAAGPQDQRPTASGQRTGPSKTAGLAHVSTFASDVEASTCLALTLIINGTDLKVNPRSD